MYWILHYCNQGADLADEMQAYYNVHWASKETYHFFRAKLTKISYLDTDKL